MARADWLEAGTALLAGGGAAALTIERLCVLTGRSKGAFYHHFGNMPAFEQALLGHWAEANRARIRAAAGQEAGALPELALGLAAGLEQAVRRWAAVHAGARAELAALDDLRMAWLAERLGGAETARLLYAAFIGLLGLGGPEGVAAPLALLRRSLPPGDDRP